MALHETASTDVAAALAAHVARSRYEDLSPRDVEATKKSLLDTIGCALAGSARPPCPDLAAFVADQGGKPEATIISFGTRVPLRNAVLVNGVMARALDLDDVYEEKVPTHASVIAVPAALATAERKGGVSGRELITAVAVGQDIMIRLARACDIVPMSRGRSVTGGFGSFGAAATAAKVLGFDAGRVVDALGIAYCQTAAEMQCYLDGATCQRLHQGMSTSAGVFAAVMAEIGVTGSRNVFEGKHGYYHLWEGGEYSREELLAGLGSKFYGSDSSVKPFPSCKGTHCAMEGALTLAIEHDIKPEEVAEIVVQCPAELEEEWDSVGLFRPEKAEPKGDVEAKFSTLWGVALMVVNRRAWIDDFTIEGVRRAIPTVAPLARKVKGVFDPNMRRSDVALGPVAVHIRLNDGRSYSRFVEHVMGSPRKPLSWDDMAARFRDCATRGLKPLPQSKMDRIIAMVQELESLDDVSRLVQDLA